MKLSIFLISLAVCCISNACAFIKPIHQGNRIISSSSTSQCHRRGMCSSPMMMKVDLEEWATVLASKEEEAVMKRPNLVVKFVPKIALGLLAPFLIGTSQAFAAKNVSHGICHLMICIDMCGHDGGWCVVMNALLLMMHNDDIYRILRWLGPRRTLLTKSV